MQISRRSLFRYTALGAIAPLAACSAQPTLIRARPVLTHGVASGDMRTDGALIWARSDSPATMIVETSATESFSNAVSTRGPLLTPQSDGTGVVRLGGLSAGEQIHYRVTLESDDGAKSEPATGVFTTAPDKASNIRLLWSGDTAGQGYGINPDMGGMTIFGAMADRNPDLFIHSGDVVYADGPLKETLTLPDGRIWRNAVSEAKSAVAQTIDQYRGQYAYNLTDANYQRFNASVAQIVQWDDHETVNNWYPGEILDLPEYTEKNVDVLATRAMQAHAEWNPVAPKEAVDGRVYRKIAYGPMLDVFVLDMRSYKDANNVNTGSTGEILGATQRQWLINELGKSTATWKVIANDLPLGLVVPDGKTAQEAVSNGDPGLPLGRETDIAQVLTAIDRGNVTGTVWLTADVHYTAAHHYSPERAAYKEFAEFWEFVSGPLNAGAFGPNKLDPTFGPEAVFVHAPLEQNSSPLDAYQHFGEVLIDGDSHDMTVNLCDATGATLFTQVLTAPRV